MHHFWQRIQKGPLLAALLEESGSLRPVVVLLVYMQDCRAGDFCDIRIRPDRGPMDRWSLARGVCKDGTARFMRKMEDGGSPKMQL